jgi:hypothetical protein
MNSPPREIGRLEVVLYSPIDERHNQAEFRRHVIASAAWGPAAGLAICRDADSGSFYLFGCDANWSSVTDTWHETLEKAMRQAEAEYPGISRTWQTPTGSG